MNTISKAQFKQYIESFNFTALFNQLGWNYLNEQTYIKLKEEIYWFHSVAEKSGFRILVFKPAAHQDLPDYATRLQLDRKIGKLFREHLIIFCDKNHSVQIWQLFVKQLGKPSRLSETRWHKGQDPELLYQKTSNLFFTLDQEENITIADVVDVVNENFSKNVEQVTKKFYENFRKEHKKFIEFIKGISVVTDREWYASLMLNRLMFCYFIQKKGFLDNNLNYLKDKLAYCQQKKGKDKFYVSFYKNFLLALFHQGLGSPEQSEELKKEIGKIPYLNGGLFDVHELEKQYKDIDIKDEAFENIFNFFDQYNWHLDTRMNASGKDINPDVIGYIFEKYINDRAQMGAYYTKEDITDYISKNCIIPFLFDETFRTLRQAQGAKSAELVEAEIWQMLKKSGDTYIYDAVKKGINTEKLDFSTDISIDDPNHPLWADLPEEIREGFRPDLKDKLVVADEQPHLWQIRKEWNKPAPENIALPTEIYRELIDRRKRYWEIRKKIDNGEITHINDFITYNLNIRQFAQDVIDNHSSPDFIRHFYKALSSITILDPTCGSGAFLFAAMNILEPLYESCLQRMRAFVEDEDFENKNNKSNFRNRFKDFRSILAETQNEHHPNLTYFIYKSIILRNLYGVDIMKEAVEIAKLRLFLKLVATVDADYTKPNLGLEPLPDIDFNIRAGNTLVGYATEAEIAKSFEGKLDFDNDTEKIKEKCDIVARAFNRYKEIQLTTGDNYNDFKQAKDELNERLKQLTAELDLLLAKTQYGIDITKNRRNQENLFQSWYRQHQPFHWFAEFYEIIHDRGGFDVIIGNPPYVEYSKIKKEYAIKGFLTERCGNLYAYVVEKGYKLIRDSGFVGFIIPISLPSTPRMEKLRQVLEGETDLLFNANFADRPGTLFNGVHQKLSISIGRRSSDKLTNFYSTNFTHWYSKGSNNERLILMDKITYLPVQNRSMYWFKIGNQIEPSIFEKISQEKSLSLNFLNNTNFCAYLNVRMMFWGKCFVNSKKSSEYKIFYFEDAIKRDAFVSLMNSSLFFYFWELVSDCWHITNRELNEFKCNLNSIDNYISNLANKLEIDLESKKVFVGTVQTDYEYYHKKSKHIIDEIDTVLAEHYGFTEEELDFIINYDIKYRMGKELEEEE